MESFLLQTLNLPLFTLLGAQQDAFEINETTGLITTKKVLVSFSNSFKVYLSFFGLHLLRVVSLIPSAYGRRPEASYSFKVQAKPLFAYGFESCS